MSEFGIPKPIIYPVSAWQGLLAKLIQQEKATESDIKDFEKFFSARYAERDEKGRRIIPLPEEIAPQALVDSGIVKIQETVIQTITQNSGWNLLCEVLATLKKAAQAIDETFITEIRGWNLEFEQLQQKTEEYKKRSDSARKKVAIVKNSVEEQKQILISEFSKGIDKFAETAKKNIALEIEKVAQNKSKKPSYRDKDKNLLTYIGEKLGSWFEGNSSSEPYRIRVSNRKDAEKISKTINEYCTPIIHSFWVDTQDKLVEDGTRIREEIVQKIQKEIQAISDELSEYLGDALQVEIRTNPIQFPQFKFLGIDAKIQDRQEAITKIRKETRTKSRPCNSDKVYEVDVPYQETVISYEIDLQLTLQVIQKKIDEQVKNSLEALQDIIQKQVSEDFYNAGKQINDYINKFQADFDYLLKQRATREVEAPEIIAKLENQRIQINEYLTELQSIRELLDSWKPIIQ